MALVIRALGGLLIWAFGFALLYALHGLVCAAGWGARPLAGPVTIAGAVLIGTWLVLLAVAALFLILLRRTDGDGRAGFLQRLAMIGAWSGLAGLLFMGAPVLLPAQCL
ncbi:hypothetical protein [Phreatobacter sp.]|uniref:hypothetical protein n=1 Tax=Phreatobacter sp. TaxID=1966341 RepID=UPI003F72BEBC